MTGVKNKLGQALSAYLSHSSDLSMQLRSRLYSMQKDLSPGVEDSIVDSVNVNALQFEVSVMDEPIINSRAGLYIYLSSMVCLRLFVVPEYTR